MAERTLVTMMIPLSMTLETANEIERESRRSGQSIPEMLSMMLENAMRDQQVEEFEQMRETEMNGTVNGESRLIII